MLFQYSLSNPIAITNTRNIPTLISPQSSILINLIHNNKNPTFLNKKILDLNSKISYITYHSTTQIHNKSQYTIQVTNSGFLQLKNSVISFCYLTKRLHIPKPL